MKDIIALLDMMCFRAELLSCFRGRLSLVLYYGRWVGVGYVDWMVGCFCVINEWFLESEKERREGQTVESKRGKSKIDRFI